MSPAPHGRGVVCCPHKNGERAESGEGRSQVAKLNHFRNEARAASVALEDLADSVETEKGPRGWRR